MTEFNMDARMEQFNNFLKNYATGRRDCGDALFVEGDSLCGSWNLQGVVELDEEELCHHELTPFHCEVPGCGFTSRTLLESEQHYNTRHRFECVQCHKHLATPHLLDIHLCEHHDSFFALLAAKQPSYSCYVVECTEKFWCRSERLNHCVLIHKYPKDYRYDGAPKTSKKSKAKNKNANKSKDRSAAVQEPSETHGEGNDQVTTNPEQNSAKLEKKTKKRGGMQHLGGGRGGRGGSLNWYQQRNTTPQTSTDIDMQDLQHSLPSTS